MSFLRMPTEMAITLISMQRFMQSPQNTRQLNHRCVRSNASIKQITSFRFSRQAA